VARCSAMGRTILIGLAGGLVCCAAGIVAGILLFS
jgi:hypothetical protein